MHSNPQKTKKIGVFDSGIGGLTVLKELNSLFPYDSFIYIGDTARLPYGTKSRETVIRYAESLCLAILQHDVDAIVVACNTASTHALDAVTEMAAGIPVIGMIGPAAAAALHASHNGQIAVMATSGTIHSGAYARMIGEIEPRASVHSISAQMLVALAEEGWSHFSDPIARGILHRYLDPVFDHAETPDTLILGCTHFPVFAEMIGDILGPSVALINSGAAAAKVLSQCLPASTGRGDNDHRIRFFATDDTVRFARNAIRFFDHQLEPSQVELIDISVYAADDGDSERARQAMSRRQNPSGQSMRSTAA